MAADMDLYIYTYIYIYIYLHIYRDYTCIYIYIYTHTYIHTYVHTHTHIYRDFPGGSVVKNPPAMQESWLRSLGWENPLEEEMETYSSILAWKIPWAEESGGVQSIGS